MEAFERVSRAWRKSRKRGVSPIIATILLVAITVVLAAVLYVLVSGLIHTGASTPYNVGMGTATPSNPAANTYWEVIPLSPTTGLTTAMFGLVVQNVNSIGVGTNTGAPANCKVNAALTTANCGAPTASGNWYVALVGQANSTVVSVYTGLVWATNPGTVAVTASMELVLVSYVTYAGIGDQLFATSAAGSSISGSATL
jgi:flagellin-like protein